MSFDGSTEYEKETFLSFVRSNQQIAEIKHGHDRKNPQESVSEKQEPKCEYFGKQTDHSSGSLYLQSLFLRKLQSINQCHAQNTRSFQALSAYRHSLG